VPLPAQGPGDLADDGVNGLVIFLFQVSQDRDLHGAPGSGGSGGKEVGHGSGLTTAKPMPSRAARRMRICLTQPDALEDVKRKTRWGKVRPVNHRPIPKAGGRGGWWRQEEKEAHHAQLLP